MGILASAGNPQIHLPQRGAIIKRVVGTYRYYLTKAGRAATAAAEPITEAVIVPTMI